MISFIYTILTIIVFVVIIYSVLKFFKVDVNLDWLLK